MDVSPQNNAPTSSGSSSVGVEALKKSLDVAERSALKVLESATEQAQAVSSHKTGIGTQLNVTG